MRVLAPEGLFTSARVSQLDLYKLFSVCQDGRHRLLIHPDPSSAFENWLESRSQPEREECQLVIDESLRNEAREPSATTIRVKASGEPDFTRGACRIPLSTAVQFLDMPLELWLENHRHDLNFLKAVARGGRNDRLQRALANQWIRTQPGSGITGLYSQIESAVARLPQQLRMWVLFDRDGLRPGHESRDSGRLRNLCQIRSLRYHQLHRRTIENYLPREALEGWSRTHARHSVREDRRRLVDAFLALTEAQKHFFNFKHGFSGDVRRPDRHEAGDLYNDVPEATKAILHSGFPLDLVNLFDSQASGPFEEDWLIRDGQASEIDPMLDDLLSLV